MSSSAIRGAAYSAKRSHELPVKRYENHPKAGGFLTPHDTRCFWYNDPMTPLKRKTRTLRVKKMNAILEKLFPSSLIHLKHSNSFELLVAVILSAQCTDARVNEVTRSLFTQFRTIEDYANASQIALQKAVFRTGFYRAKAKYIQSAANAILKQHNGKVPSTMAELIALPGVGRKTANVVLSTAFSKSEGIAVDTHVRRFAIRFDLSDYRDPKRIEQDLMEIMPERHWWAFNHRLVEYGRAYCPARKHDCTKHPLTKVWQKANTIWPRAR
jgi:endonuclease III